jgi:hypothetical protein
MSAIVTHPYGNYRTKDFDPNYNRNNYGVYDENALATQGYSNDLIGKDEYGQNYNLYEPNLEDFKDRLKTTRKSRFTDTTRGPTYSEIAKRRETRPTVADRMWDAYNKTKFGDQYQRGKKYREKDVKEIQQEKTNAEQMYVWIDKDESLNKSDKGVQNLMRAVQNPYYEVMRDLYKVLVEGGHKLKINPKHLPYNSLHYD